MSINLIVVDFNNPIKTDNEDILYHLGYVVDVSGKHVEPFIPRVFELTFNGLNIPMYGTLFRLMTDQFDLPYLTLAIVDPIPKDQQADELFVRRRTQEMTQLLTWVITTFELQVTGKDLEMLQGEDSLIYKFNVDLTPMEKKMISASRSFMRAVNPDNPPKE